MAVIVVAVASAVVGGCDWLELESDADNREAADRQAAEKAAQELTVFRERVVKFAAEKLKLAESELSPFAKRVTEVRKDVEELTAISRRIMEEKDDKKREPPREERLTKLLRDPTVNALAVKYLATDFMRATTEFEVAVDDYKAAKRRYDDAIREADTIYGNSIAEAAKWSKATAEQREQEIARLQRDVKKLETNRKHILKECEQVTHNSLVGKKRAERERSEKLTVFDYKIRDIDNEINRKRRQIDTLRHPDNSRRFEERAVHDAQVAQSRANSIRRTHLVDLERQVKPKKSLLEITSDYEQRTIGALTKTLADKLAKLDADELALRKKISTIKNAKLAIPLADRQTLERLRKTLEN